MVLPAPPPPAGDLLPLMPADEVAALRRWSAAELVQRCVRPGQRAEAAVLVHADGPLAVAFNLGAAAVRTELGAWDTLSMPPGFWRQFINHGAQDAHALLVVAGDARKTPRFDAAVHAAAAQVDLTLDGGGRLARNSPLPPPVTV